MKVQMLAAIIALSSMSIAASENKRAWNRSNNPHKLAYSFISKTNGFKTLFSQLPRSGSLTTKPWSGDYWPTHKGGISYRWNQSSSDNRRINYKLNSSVKGLSLYELSTLSPAEKYDLFVGGNDFTLTTFERERTNIMKTIPEAPEYDESFEIPAWEGLCHAWAPATLLFSSPKAVTLRGVNGIEIPFGASDIKALLTFYLHYNKAPTQSLGGRCNVDLKELKRKLERNIITKRKYDRIVDNGACEDTNAGAFHLVLTNQVGLKDEGFIADVTRGQEVWNQAVHSYKTRVLRVKRSASTKAAPGTVEDLIVEAHVTYTAAIQHSWRETSSNSSSLIVKSISLYS